MTKQDPRFAQKITNERARELYAECVETLYEYKTKIAPTSSDERPRYSIDVLELGQILNDFISSRAALALAEVPPAECSHCRPTQNDGSSPRAGWVCPFCHRHGRLPLAPPVDQRIVAAIDERNARTDRCGDELVDQIVHDLCDPIYIEQWMPEHMEGGALLQAMSSSDRERIVRQVLDQLDQAALAQLRARTQGKKA